VHPLDLSDDWLATMVKIFQGLILAFIRSGRSRRRYLTLLSRLHHSIFTFLDSSVDMYTRLSADS
jgi:hypothetical protein